MAPQELVCTRCWHDFFDTEAFERCCTYNVLLGDHDIPSLEAVATVREIRDADCTWCKYLRSFVRDSWTLDDKVTVHLSPSHLSSSTPMGRNIFYLSISCETPSAEWVGGAALFLHAWTTPDDSASKHITARPLRTDVNSDIARQQLRTWLEDCAKHERCTQVYSDPALPTRVIEINPKGRQHPRLLDSKGLHGQYATLSYRWGNVSFSKLTESNQNELMEELKPSSLPLTFNHAITTARNLSIPYLWIDALCIIQDSKEDKAREISQMKHIYASSALTIVAASANSVSEGFLQPRHHSEPSHLIPFRAQPGVFGTMSINELDAASYDERLEPLAQRAWALQEQLLGQRTLTFTSRTMMWKCLTGIRNFGDSLYFPHDLDSGYNDNDEKYSLNLRSLLLDENETRLHPEKTLSCWLRLVTAYSLRTASLEQDKLNAIAGIASHPSLSHNLGPGYYAGLWQYNLARQLTWRTSRRYRTLAETETTIHRTAKYRAPSWSWASIEGGVIHFEFSFSDPDDSETETPPDIICKIVECSTTPIQPTLNPLGEISSGTLRMKTLTRRAYLDPSTSNIFLLPPPSSTGESPETKTPISIAEATNRHIAAFKARHPDVDLDADPKATHGTEHRNMRGVYDETGKDDTIDVLCAAITLDQKREDGVEGLLLRQSGDGASYVRVGFFERGRNEDFQNGMGVEMEIVVV